jgi:hypothetical protein
VVGFSAASRRRLLKLGLAIDWDRIVQERGGSFLMVTLTYGTDPGRERVKRDLDVAGKRFRRRFGTLIGLWKLEFQRRGVVHLHLMLWAPITGRLELADLRRWTWASWEGVTGERFRVDVDYLRADASSAGAYFAGYSVRGSKEYQHVVPEGWESVGRWWGRWGVQPSWDVIELRDAAEFFQVRRLMTRYQRSRTREAAQARGRAPRRVRGLSGFRGCWVAGRSPGSLEAALLRAVVVR